MAEAVLNGRTVLITGGTGDVGQALVRAFVGHGAVVSFQYAHDIATAQALAREVDATPIQMDFSTRDFLVQGTTFDILVNNAGINVTSAALHEVSDEDWHKTLLVNLEAPFRLARACLPYMMSRGWGRIINVSSIYGLRAVEGNLPYTVSKHALSGMTKTIAKEYGPLGITCNEICPGPIAGALLTRIARDEARIGGGTADEYLLEVVQGIPARRLGVAADVAAVALFLASPSSGYVNGCSIPVDGGLIA